MPTLSLVYIYNMANFLRKIVLTLGLAFFSFLPACRVLAAEKITFFIPPLGEFAVSVDSLVIFAEEGRITEDFRLYAKHFSPEELAKLRSFLNKVFPLNEINAFEFFNTNFGKEIVRQLSLAINSPPEQSQPFLEGAVIAAAANPNGFKIIDVIKNYGSPTLPINLETVRNTIDEADILYQTTERIFHWLDSQAVNAASTSSTVSLSDLSATGNITWKSETLNISRPNKDPLTAFVYLPQNLLKPAPIVVITPGLNSDFQSLRYVAEHLASYGFATVGIDFPESDAARMKDALQGLDTFPSPNAWMEQPQDVTLVLNTLEQKMESDPNWRGRLDTNNVGILGQSLGGYTAIATGGANIQKEAIIQECAELNNDNQINLNPALLWQCQGVENISVSDNLREPRIKAVIAINPVTNPVFGTKGVSMISVPTMFIAGSADIFAPPLPEQIHPFAATPQEDKYLILVKNGTHLSFLQGTDNLPTFIVGEGRNLAYDYLKSVSLAFFNLYLNQQTEFQSYLTETTIQNMGQNPLPVRLIKSLTQEQLNEALKPIESTTPTR